MAKNFGLNNRGNERKITLLLPSCGLNYLWQLGGIKALSDLGLMKKIDAVYGCSGGAWASIFMGMGEEVMNDWLSIAGDFYSEWQRKNRFKYLRRAAVALTEDSRSVLGGYGFFDGFQTHFNIVFKLFELYPNFGFSFLNITRLSPEEIHKLAIASSTIPGITGTAAHYNKTFFIDGGIRHGFRKQDINDSDQQNVVLLLDPHRFREEKYQYIDLSINPSNRLPSGLRLGLPFLISPEKIQSLIDQGYKDITQTEKNISSLLRGE